MTGQCILIVEDDEDIRELIRYNLAKEGYNPVCVTSGEDALATARTEQLDLVILDLMLPGVDGFDVCKSLRANESTREIPIIMLTARAGEADIISGLEMGADDYLTKPFSPRILIARIRAVLRRKAAVPPGDTDKISITTLTIDPGRHEVITDNKPVELSATEFKILHFLARRPGWVFTRDQIIHAVHGEYCGVTDRSVDVQIVALRKKLGTAGQCIQTVRGIGYRFREPD